MKNVLLTVILSLLIFCMTWNIALALPVTWHINGNFGDEVTTQQDYWPSAPNPGPYPFPELYGGHFEGIFSYDLDDPPVSRNRLPLRKVLIGIYTNSNDLLRTITEGENNHFFSFPPYADVKFIFGTSSGILNDVQDLRVAFSGNLTDPNMSLIEKLSLLETDAEEVDSRYPNPYWDLNIISAKLTHISGPIEDIPPIYYPYDPSPAPLPEPTTILLLGAGIGGICLFGRKKFFLDK
ncbi:MAG: PEP-CTERM sorting domain-containing protein [Desulfobacterales bacterium]|nr:PEP-CTERM sorting domain-containing protein [Desulfobacterales bacterium]